MGVWLLNFTPVPTRQNEGFFCFEYSEWSKNHRVFSLYMHDYIPNGPKLLLTEHPGPFILTDQGQIVQNIHGTLTRTCDARFTHVYLISVFVHTPEHIKWRQVGRVSG